MKFLITVLFFLFTSLNINASDEIPDAYKGDRIYPFAVSLYEVFYDNVEESEKMIEVLLKEVNREDIQYTPKEKLTAYMSITDYYYYYANMDKFNYYLDKSFENSKLANNFKLEVLYYYKGIYLSWLGNDIEEAIKYFKLGIKEALLVENDITLFILYNALAGLYSKQSNPSKALEYYRKAEIATSDISEKIFVRQGIIILYYNLGIFELAKKELKYSLDMINNWVSQKSAVESVVNKNGLIITVHEYYTGVYLETKEYKKALEHAIITYDLTKPFGDKSKFLNAIVKRAISHAYLGQLKEAEKYMQEAFDLKESEQFSDLLSLSNYYTYRVDYFMHIEDFEKAELELNFLVKLLENENAEGVERISKKASEVYKSTLNYKKALDYQKIYIEYYEKTRNNKEYSLATFLYEKYKVLNLENNKNSLEKEKIKNIKELNDTKKLNVEIKKQVIINTIIITIILLLLPFYFYSYFKKKRIANTDGLTNLYNRRYIFDLMKKSLKNKNEFSLILLDIDHFKNINDTFGHDVGDKVLIETSNCINNIIPKDAILSRVGGEEFLIYIEKEKDYATELAESVRVGLENNSFKNIDSKLKVTGSFGVDSSIRKSNIAALYKNVDDNLYKAKQSGRNKVIS